MKELTNALERILKWTQQHRPRYINYLQPGLSRDEIEDLVKDLPFQIPSELYELYQWRNSARDGDLGQETAWALGEVGDIKAIKPLSELLEDEDNSVREGVKEALSKLKNIDAK